MVDAFVVWLINLVGELNAFVASLGIFASGGANKIPYKVDLGTAMADPTAGWLRLNSAAQNAATAMVVDVIGADTIDYTTLLSTFGASTSAVLGTIRIERIGDASKFLVFNLTAVTTPAGYRQFTIVCVGYSSANPFVQGDQVVLSFDRTGDKGLKGDTGDPGSVSLLASYTVGAAVAQIDFLNLFTDTYSKYVIDVDGMSPSAVASLQLYMATGGAVDNGANYSNMTSDGASGSTSSAPLLSAAALSTTSAVTGTFEIRSARSATTKKVIGFRGRLGLMTSYTEGGYTSSAPISGFRLNFSASANISAGTVRVYGFKA
jgi:hypothetical protein